MAVAALSPISGPAACQVIPFVDQICFIADQDDNDITSPLCSHLLNPTWSVEEGLPICADRSSVCIVDDRLVTWKPYMHPAEQGANRQS